MQYSEPGSTYRCEILNTPPPSEILDPWFKILLLWNIEPPLIFFCSYRRGVQNILLWNVDPPPSSDFLLQLLERGFKILNDTGHLPLTPSFLILNTCIQCMIIVKQSTHYKGHTTSFLLTRDQTMIAFTCMSWSIKGATHLCTITYVCITGQYSPRYLSRIIHWTQF